MPIEENEEQSIKARAKLIYDNEAAPSGPKLARKPFVAYLRETPPTPLSPMAQAILYAIAVVTVLLLIAAMVKGPRPKPTVKTSGPDALPTSVISHHLPTRDPRLHGNAVLDAPDSLQFHTWSHA